MTQVRYGNYLDFDHLQAQSGEKDQPEKKKMRKQISTYINQCFDKTEYNGNLGGC